ncbi:AAA family ATPase [Paenibacillus radicis (ex Xue et al. 2023)]|uniref:ATP-binding protein n=1 Tax=Paenibacillus radicis (ex Xue et al. 2023) TaxID=2972489 RepID=A0ABT1YJL4_9BACL|nr:ATP-binding protein [Paenibacillus radicis (ex Xue et al. 2023)]MCR8632915.1 ATP-binding protein [Paenibacillus radicis (ex Xue et al. 2023)]
MKKLIFFVGPAGAGKTTIAKALARKRRIAFLDMDTLLRPSAEVIMRVSGNDPNDRDSLVYKTHCRDLGYRVTMDAALENVELGIDVIVVGPFTKEIGNPLWVEQELERIGATRHDVDVKAIFVSLPDKELYRQRIEQRGLEMDEWKLANWSEFSHSLMQRQIKWPLPASSIHYLDNSGPLTENKISLVEQFVYGDGHDV